MSDTDKEIKIIRAQHDASTRWFITSRTSAQDSHLSFRTRGILWYLLSKPDDWETRIEDIQREGNIGRDAAKKCLKELEKFGYLSERKRYRDDKQQWQWTPYVLHEEPSTGFQSMAPSTDFPSTENQTTARQSMENQSIYKEQKTENREQRTEKQKTENKSSSSLSSPSPTPAPAQASATQSDDDDLISNPVEQKIEEAGQGKTRVQVEVVSTTQTATELLAAQKTPPRVPAAPPRHIPPPPDDTAHRLLSEWQGILQDDFHVIKGDYQDDFRKIEVALENYQEGPTRNKMLECRDYKLRDFQQGGKPLLSFGYVLNSLETHYGKPGEARYQKPGGNGNGVNKFKNSPYASFYDNTPPADDLSPTGTEGR